MKVDKIISGSESGNAHCSEMLLYVTHFLHILLKIPQKNFILKLVKKRKEMQIIEY